MGIERSVDVWVSQECPGQREVLDDAGCGGPGGGTAGGPEAEPLEGVRWPSPLSCLGGFPCYVSAGGATCQTSGPTEGTEGHAQH